MSNLNFGLWNSTNLHTFKLTDINLEELVLHVKLNVMDIFRMDEIDRIEFLHCGQIMANGQKISTYVSDNHGIIFVIKKDSIDRTRKLHTTEQLNNMLVDYDEAFHIAGFEEVFIDTFHRLMGKHRSRSQSLRRREGDRTQKRASHRNWSSEDISYRSDGLSASPHQHQGRASRSRLNTVKPETINALVNNIPELSTDSISLSIIKDPFLLKTLLEPNTIKIQMEKHPALLLAVHYLIKNVLRDTLDKNLLYSSVHLTDEDFSEGDDIEIRYSGQYPGRPDASTYGITTSQSTSALQSVNTNNLTSNEHVFQIPLLTHGFHEDVLSDVSFDENNHEDSTDNINGSNNTGLMHQLYQMRELGLANHILNFRALEVAEGNVQEAIELILNGIID